MQESTTDKSRPRRKRAARFKVRRKGDNTLEMVLMWIVLYAPALLGRGGHFLIYLISLAAAFTFLASIYIFLSNGGIDIIDSVIIAYKTVIEIFRELEIK